MKMFCKFCFCISALFILILCAGCGSVEYSVQDFADVTVAGYTEHGTLSIKVKDSAVNQIYADGQKDKTAALRFAETFKFTYDGQDEEDSYFNNGDVVTIDVTYDKSLANSLGISFVDSSFQYTVNGLEDKLETSPFEGLNVKFSGVAPYGTVQLDKSNCIQYVIDNVTFYCDNYDLSNGDKVVVRAEFNSEIAERNGYVFTEDVKKYTVVGLSKYVKSMTGVSYDATTAKMRKMIETYISEDDDTYKSLNWFFGEEDTDTDSDDTEEGDAASADDNLGEEDEDTDIFGEDIEGDEEGESESENSGEPTESKKKKKSSDVQMIRNDFALSDFKAKFDYTPVECYYTLNPIQYSDNQFYSIYKVKGTFVCEDSDGSGYIKPGDVLVGEIYVIARLTGGSVDIKNNLYYEDSVLKNYHSYSIHSVPKYSDVTDEIFKNTTYLIETLDYVEDENAYNDFVKKLETKSSKKEESHITIDTSTDTSSENKRNSSESDTDTTENELDSDYDENGDVQYYDPDLEDGQNDYDNDYSDDYDNDVSYDVVYDEQNDNQQYEYTEY